MASVVTTLIKDRYPKVKNWQSGLGFAVFGVVSGSVYLTPVKVKKLSFLFDNFFIFQGRPISSSNR